MGYKFKQHPPECKTTNFQPASLIKSIKPISVQNSPSFFKKNKVFFRPSNKPINIEDIRHIFYVVIQQLLTSKTNPPKVVSTQTRGDLGPSNNSPRK